MAGPPVIPAELAGYDSYNVDPKWARQLTAIWAAFLALIILLSLPNLYWRSALGISERNSRDMSGKRLSWVPRFVLKGWTVLRWSLPGINISMGQLILIFVYLAVTLVHMIKDTAPLIKNANRAGFITLAQLSPVFLLASKASPLSLLIPYKFSYETVNFLHRWTGRTLFLSALLHGAMWINNHIRLDQPIIGELKESTGIAAFAVLCILVLTSLNPVRRVSYQFFYYIHMLTFPAFFIVICYHTPYARPWIFPPLAIYGWDYALRMFRSNIKEAILVAKGEGMTLIRVSNCSSGWTAGQHVRLRVFLGGRHFFETHPFSIMSAPGNSKNEIVLGARVCGDWTKALNSYTLSESHRLAREKEEVVAVPVFVTIDGPYGGLDLPRSLDEYDRILVFAGGSGATYGIGALEGLLAYPSTRRKNQVVEFVWCLRSYGTIRWFSDQLASLSTRFIQAGIKFHIAVYVTCLCDPEAVPEVTNMDVVLEGCRPNLTQSIRQMVSTGDVKLAVIAAGPESLTRHVGNAVSSLVLSSGVGEIDYHGESYAI